MLSLAVTYFVGLALADDVEVRVDAESIIIESERAEAGSGRALYGPYEVEFEELSGELSGQELEARGATVSATGWGWVLWSQRVNMAGGLLSGDEVTLSKCVDEWRPWELRADRATLAAGSVALEQSRLSLFDLVEIPIPVDSISLTPSSWAVGLPAIDWVDDSLRVSVPLWFKIDSARSASVAVGWWQGATLSGKMVDQDNGEMLAEIAYRESGLLGYLAADYQAGDRGLGIIGDGSALLGAATLSWFDEYELRSRDFLEHRAMLFSHGFSLERFGWFSGEDKSAVHSLGFTGGNEIGSLVFERHRFRLYNDGVNSGADGVVAVRSMDRLGHLEVAGQLIATGEIEDLEGEEGANIDLDGAVNLSLPFWGRFGEVVHEASVGIKVETDLSVGPRLTSQFYGRGTQSVEIWAPITEGGFELGGAFSHRQGGWFVDLFGEHSAEVNHLGGALGFNNDFYELSLSSWIDETMVAAVGTTSVFVPSAHGRWRPSLSSIVSDEGVLFMGAGLGWIADCGCLDVEVNVSAAEDRTTPIVGGVLRLESIY